MEFFVLVAVILGALGGLAYALRRMTGGHYRLYWAGCAGLMGAALLVIAAVPIFADEISASGLVREPLILVMGGYALALLGLFGLLARCVWSGLRRAVLAAKVRT